MDEYKSIFDFQLFNVNEEEKKSKEKLRKIKHNLNFTSKNEENIKIKLNSMHNYRDEIHDLNRKFKILDLTRTDLDISEVITLLNSDENDSRYQGLHILAKRLRLAENDNNRLLNLIDDITISNLIELLKDSCEEVVCDSLFCIEILTISSKSDTFIKKRLFMLLDKLIINLPEMKLTIINIIENLCVISYKAKRKFLNGLICRTIQNLICETSKEEIVIKCISLIRITFCTLPTFNKMSSDLFCLLIGLLIKTKNSLIQEDLLYIIHYCAEKNKNMIAFLFSKENLHKIFSLTSSENIYIQINSIRIMGYLVQEAQSEIHLILDMGFIQILMNLMVNYKKEVYMIRKEVYTIPSYLSARSQNHLELVIKYFIPLLKEILFNEKEDSLKLIVVQTFCNLTVNTEKESAEYFFDQGINYLILEFLKSNENKITFQALEALENIINIDKKYFQGNKILNIIKCDNNFLDVLKFLKNHPIDYVNIKVKKILEENFLINNLRIKSNY